MVCLVELNTSTVTVCKRVSPYPSPVTLVHCVFPFSTVVVFQGIHLVVLDNKRKELTIAAGLRKIEIETNK